MDALPVQNTTLNPILSSGREQITLNTIRRSMRATARGKDRRSISHGPISTELEVYLNLAMFDLSLRLDKVERYLKDQSRAEAAPSEILSQFAEMLKEMRLCSEIGNFAVSQLAPRN